MLASLLGCSEPDQHAAATQGSTESAQYDPVSRERVVELDAQTQERLRLRVEPLAAVSVQPEVKGYGRVLDPAPLSSLFAQLATAQAAQVASEKEYQRVKTLAAKGNASARVLETTRAATERDRLAVQSTREQLELSWGRALLKRSDVGDLVRRLAALEELLVRIDLPAGESLAGEPTTARLVSLRGETVSAAAEFLSRASTTDPQLQGQGFLFLVKADSLHLTPESALVGYLELEAEPVRGVIVPAPAVVRHQERAWVYLQLSPEAFARRPIAMAGPRDSGWLVTAGLEAGDRIVVDGAQLLLSEELKSQIQMAD